MPRFKKISTILIWSQDYKKLADWYKSVLNFKILDKLNHPEDTGIQFEVEKGGTSLWIGQHSEVKGKNKDPHRHMFNLTVDSVSKTYLYLVKKNVKFFAKPFKAPTFDKYFATFFDLDGNFVQIIGGK